MSTVVLETKNLRKEFGSFIAVKDLSIQVYEGEIFGFLGPNGAGKSTSIAMICGLLNPTSGSLYLQGKEILKSDKSLRVRVGICPQNIILWTRLTCLEQLLHIAEMYEIDSSQAKTRALHLLEEMGLIDQKNKLAGTLSGGMQRRLNIILALMHDPEIIVLDEPEAGLDPQSRILVREYIKSLAKIKTVILTIHNMDEAERLCDRVAIIDQGKLLSLDTIENLKKKNRQEIVLELQFESEKIAIAANQVLSSRSSIKIQRFHNQCILSDPNVLEQLSDILQVLKKNSLSIVEMKVRENSLEDIFIQLTGRRLRE
ncbi:MAG TPA: ABC transporter ATP-binding protein [Leptospiraceae bacterium]|nr:ABC transporter ATP-binding protein [Leptospiraceae bacterium]HMW06279.1 ABC transporter ATP-binding protein [Leptospiraceae bacterium]HMX34604.1 ABC transporter ATP-binding protein [Leptospiraceae bacterium]HMY31741.1 ABC transporter ATP-binding protein [Leptospiraceae bacterium]HMZ64534.1 ABC transporter ATP-binding protein [Leptospiraceae bacterium]